LEPDIKGGGLADMKLAEHITGPNQQCSPNCSGKERYVNNSTPPGIAAVQHSFLGNVRIEGAITCTDGDVVRLV
jgi:hypothetical protein